MKAAAAWALPLLVPAARESSVEGWVCKESRVNIIVFHTDPAAQPSIATLHMHKPSKLFIYVIISYLRPLFCSDFLGLLSCKERLSFKAE